MATLRQFLLFYSPTLHLTAQLYYLRLVSGVCTDGRNDNSLFQNYRCPSVEKRAVSRCWLNSSTTLMCYCEGEDSPDSPALLLSYRHCWHRKALSKTKTITLTSSCSGILLSCALLTFALDCWSLLARPLLTNRPQQPVWEEGRQIRLSWHSFYLFFGALSDYAKLSC